MSTETRSAGHWVAVTPSDTTDISASTVKGIWVGGAGNLVIVGRDKAVETLVGVPAGTLLPINPRRINATLTTATALIALYD